MRFRNKLEKDCFLIAKKIVASSGSVEIKHNEKLSTDWLHKRSQITFSGLPSKEVDVLSLNLSDSSNIYLVVSCKDFKSRCPPTHVQEWGNVVDIFNQNAIDKTYFGAVISSKGFTSGCETWATQNNLGIIPPYKGKVIRWTYDIVLKMFERMITAYTKIINKRWKQLKHNSDFYWFVYKLVTDLEYEVQI